MVIGSDWKGKKVIGEEYCKDLQFFDRIDGYSTTNILERKK
jgi:bifunctional ADP-heptose synthase (sugar kinase/adenylyltransferase)